jgi:L-2-hydroxyglutarate oxidase LhgO
LYVDLYIPHPVTARAFSCSLLEPRMSDVVIVGGGVIGCALVRELALSGVRCTLLEKSASLLAGASSGNSGLLHTGFDATPGRVQIAPSEAEKLLSVTW